MLLFEFWLLNFNLDCSSTQPSCSPPPPPRDNHWLLFISLPSLLNRKERSLSIHTSWWTSPAIRCVFSSIFLVFLSMAVRHLEPGISSHSCHVWMCIGMYFLVQSKTSVLYNNENPAWSEQLQVGCKVSYFFFHWADTSSLSTLLLTMYSFYLLFVFSFLYLLLVVRVFEFSTHFAWNACCSFRQCAIAFVCESRTSE